MNLAPVLPQRPAHVLVLRALGLGDALTGVPALLGLRRRWPAARLTLACPAPLGAWLRGLGLIDAVLPSIELNPLPRPEERVDLAVDLHGRGPESQRLLLALDPGALLAFRCPAAGVLTGPVWRPDEHEVDRWIRLVRSVGAPCDPSDLRLRSRGAAPGSHHPARAAGPIVIHPGAAFGSRRWPADRWARVAGVLARDHDVVVTGTGGEAAACAAVTEGARNVRVRDLCGALDLAALTALVAGARLVLSADTGVAHLATALAVPSVTLFGPVSPALWGPRIDPHLHVALWAMGDGPVRAIRWHASRGWLGGIDGIDGIDSGASMTPGDPLGAELDERLSRITTEDVLRQAHLLLAAVDARAPRLPGG